MNYPELRASIARNGMTIRSISSEIGITEQALHNKLAGKAEFKNSEIKKIATLLSMSMEDVNNIFFDSVVN